MMSPAKKGQVQKVCFKCSINTYKTKSKSKCMYACSQLGLPSCHIFGLNLEICMKLPVRKYVYTIM